jgi:hypothetical protein
MNSGVYQYPRDRQEMFAALMRHLRLLERYAHKAFVERDPDYGGEVAGKLRLLVTKFGSHRPLLLDLMRETGIEPRVTLGGPPQIKRDGELGPGDQVTLSEYLQLGAVGTRVPSGEFVMLNKTQFIRAWAEQTGSSHEDWKIDQSLAAVLNTPLRIGGLHGAFAELRVTTETVLHIATQFSAVFNATDNTANEDDA